MTVDTGQRQDSGPSIFKDSAAAATENVSKRNWMFVWSVVLDILQDDQPSQIAICMILEISGTTQVGYQLPLPRHGHYYYLRDAKISQLVSSVLGAMFLKSSADRLPLDSMASSLPWPDPPTNLSDK